MIRNALSPLKILFRKECRFESDRRYHHSKAQNKLPNIRSGMNSHFVFWSLLLTFALGLSTTPSLAANVESVTFAVEPGKIYVPLSEVSSRLKWHSSLSRDGGTLKINGTSVPANQTRLINGTVWLQLNALASAGATISADPEKAEFDVASGLRRFTVIAGSKRIEVDLARQRLYAYQGRLIVLDTNISTGRYGNTPAGHFTAGPYNNRMHYSSKYHNAPMPWSVQITGHIFFHGFSSVPNYPASHGCIRVPLTGANPARFLYEWVDVGTPIEISRGRKEEIRRALPAS